MKTPLHLSVALVCGSILFMSGSAFAVDRTWTGGDASSNNWNLAANWGGTVPAANDSLIFAGSTRLSPQNNFTAGSIQFNGITFAVGASAFSLSGNSYDLGGNITNSSSNLQTMGGSAFTLKSDIVINTGAPGISMSGTAAKIVGAYAIEKTGSGTWTLSADSSGYSGNMTITQGTVLNSGTGSSAFGNGTTTMANGTGVTVSATGGAIVGTGGVKIANGGTVTFAVTNPAGTVTLNSGTLFIGDATYGQGVTIVKTGDGTLSLKQTASTLGSTTASTFQINAGKLFLDNGDSNLGDGKNDVVLNGGTLSVKGFNAGANRTITLNNVAGNVIEVAAANTSTIGYTNQLTGAGGFAKTGTGNLTFSAAQNYTGATTISAGTLILSANGTFSGSPVINLGTSASQGTLNLTAKTSFAFGTTQTVAGFGTINIGVGKTVTISGNLQPGNSPGITAVTGNLALENTTATTLELAGSGGVAGTDFDQVNVSGSLAYDGTLSITSYNGWDINTVTTYNLFDSSSYSGNFDSVSVGGFGLAFDSVKTWSGTNSGTTYSLALDTGVLSVVPEPATWALLAFSLTTVMVLRRRRL
jgi:autotransporter-associated beta strand protein